MIAPLFSRRKFLVATATGAAALARPARCAEPSGKAGAFTEGARDLPLNSDADVIVCGAGPAGVAAVRSTVSPTRRDLPR